MVVFKVNRRQTPIQLFQLSCTVSPNHAQMLKAKRDVYIRIFTNILSYQRLFTLTVLARKSVSKHTVGLKVNNNAVLLHEYELVAFEW